MKIKYDKLEQKKLTIRVSRPIPGTDPEIADEGDNGNLVEELSESRAMNGKYRGETPVS